MVVVNGHHVERKLSDYLLQHVRGLEVPKGLRVRLDERQVDFLRAVIQSVYLRLRRCAVGSIKDRRPDLATVGRPCAHLLADLTDLLGCEQGKPEHEHERPTPKMLEEVASLTDEA